MPALRILGGLALSLVLAACASPVSIDEALRETDVRTVALEGRFTLYSPYDLEHTRLLAEVVEENLAAVCGTLEGEPEQPVQIHARVLDEEDSGTQGDGEETGARPARNVTGFTGTVAGSGIPAMVFFVAPERGLTAADSDAVGQMFRFNYAGRIRHELGHLCHELWMPESPTWFAEGLALEMEYSRPAGARLVPDENPMTMLLARRVHREIPLARVLDWREDVDAVARGEKPFQEGRPLAHAYVRFLLERRGGSRSIDSFRAILGMSRDEHLGLEQDWHAWIDGSRG